MKKDVNTGNWNTDDWHLRSAAMAQAVPKGFAKDEADGMDTVYH